MSESLDVAIIGMAGRFPGARNVDELWCNLERGVESITCLTDAELAASGVDARLSSQPNYVRAHASLPDIDLFDAELFNCTPHEAAALDPQHRAFLECAWQAFESAGYDPERIEGRVGVYAGSSMNGYLFHHFPSGTRVQSAEDLSALLALDKDFLATRVSYKLNLRGPSIAVQTACSTSLVAVHLACQALLLGECEVALAGGVSINVPQSVGYLYQEGGIASPDGHCRPFDCEARGTVAGSGAGVVVLKRLADAEADGDHIVAVIKGSAINNDGRAKAGFTAPSVAGQTRVIRDAHAAAGVAPNTIGYVEAHGTGTPLGDPIEMLALTRAFASSGEPARCAVGSLKSNIGHLDAAAGVAGLIKAALSLAHRRIPKSLNFEQPNPTIDFANTPFVVADHAQDYPALNAPRRAGVSSFGIGGTNAHVVLEEAQRPAREDATEPELLLLSARSDASLQAYAALLADRLEQDPGLLLADVAHTLRLGRRTFAHRTALVCSSREQAVQALRSVTTSKTSVTAEGRPVAFLFPGQGSQRTHAGRALYAGSSCFRAEIDSCAELLRDDLGGDLRRVLFPEPHEVELAEQRLARTSWAQPALFVLEYALARSFEQLGLRPSALLGHSVGEYVAACLAGTFRRDDALRVIAARGRLMESTAEGAMLAVAAHEAELSPFLARGDVALAAVNAARQCVLAGRLAAIERCEQELTARGLRSHRLRVARAFHSPLMDGILEPFRAVLASVSLAPPNTAWISNVTGRPVQALEATDPDYWVRQLRGTVRFADGLQALLHEQAERSTSPLLLELGVGETLASLGRGAGCCVIAALPEATEGEGLLGAVGRLWVEGAAIDTSRLTTAGTRRRVPLPGAPLERKRYWIEAQTVESAVSSARPAHAAEPATSLDDWFYVPSWRRVPLPARAPREQAEHWLICASAAEYERFKTVLGSADRALTWCSPVEDFSAHLHALRERGDLPTHVLHAVALEPREPPLSAELLRTAREGALESLLWLSRSIATVAAGARLIVLVNGAHDLTGGEALHPEHAPLLAAVRTLRTEYPGLHIRLVDLETAAFDARTGQALLREAALGDDERVVAHRGSYRWLPTLERHPLRDAGGTASRLRNRGVYLITGGLGGLGLECAEFLLRTVQARVVLVGRAPPNDAQRERLLRIGELNGELLLCEGDVADTAVLRDIVAKACARFGTIHGAIHAAASREGGLVEMLTSADVVRSFEAKAQGALSLCAALTDLKPDFVLLCSSLSALSGGIAQVAYAAANAFLDAFACAEHRAGRRVMSVGFDRLQGLGMAIEAEQRLREHGLSELALGGIKPTEIAPILERLFTTHGAPHLVVSTRRLDGLPKDDVGEALASYIRAARGDAARSDATSVSPDATLEEVIACLQAIWAQAFGVAEVDADQEFYALGGESLLALQILNRVRDVFGVELPLREFFEQRSPRALAHALQAARSDTRPASPDEPALVALPRRARRLRREGREES